MGWGGFPGGIFPVLRSEVPVVGARHAADPRAARPQEREELTSRHGVPVAPTIQRHQQPVSEDFLAGVFGEFQHVDAMKKRGDGRLDR